MAKLNQIVAIVQGKKSETKKALTEVFRKLSADNLFNGLSRVYTPLDDEGEQLPNEGQNIQYDVSTALKDVENVLSDMLNVVATQDVNNCNTRVDVKVGDTVVIEQVPVTYLMFLEKQIQDLETFVNGLPTLDPSVKWNFDENQGYYVSEPTKSVKTKKVLQHKVLYEATENHPAQIEKWNEDVSVGTWTTTKFSGAIPAPEKKKLIEKVKSLRDAIKFSREEANSMEVEKKEVSKGIFEYLFG